MEVWYNKMKFKTNNFYKIIFFIIWFGVKNLFSIETQPLVVLYYPVGARVNAMGNTYNSLGLDIFTTVLNPAVVALLDRRNVGVTTSLLYENTIFSSIGYLHPTLDRGNFVLNLLYLGSFGAKETDEYNIFTGKEFSYNTVVTSFGWGKELILKKFYVGAGVKFCYENLYNYNREFLTTVAGVVYKFNHGIWLASNINNILSIPIGDTEDKLPVGISMGCGFKPFERLSLGVDLGKDNTDGNIFNKYSLGLEWTPINMLSIRTGRNSFETSFGFGIRVKDINFDYAAILQEYLGVSHRVSLDFKFGKSLEEIWAEKIKELPAGEELEIVEAKLQTETERKQYFKKLINEGVKLYRNGNYTQALNNFKKAKEIEPGSTEVDIYIERIQLIATLYPSITVKDKISRLLLRGVNFFIDGDPVSAVKVINYALSLSPEDRDIQRLLTKIEENTGVRSEKIESPAGMTIVDKLHNESLIAFRKRDYAQTVKLCEEILILEPDDVLAYKRLGSAFYAMGNKTKALQMWRRALQLDPRDDKLRRMIETLQK